VKIEITQILSIFDALLSLSNEEQGDYWFQSSRSDGLIITLAISIYECKVAVTIYNTSEVAIASVHFKSCSEVNVLDITHKCLEILHSNEKGRCFISLTGNTILEYSE
jgi:hypothetical protein